MKGCIVFGCGNYGNSLYYKLRDIYQIVAYTDNNPMLWGTRMYDIPVISPQELLNYGDTDIFIAVEKYVEVADQLDSMGVRNYKISQEGFLYDYNSNRLLIPVQENAGFCFHKTDSEQLSVLFVQRTACIRTHKIASILKRQGFSVSLAYTYIHPKISSNGDYADIYDNIYSINTMQEFIDLVNNSEFDIVHSSNEPDYLTNLLLCTNKGIIHDTHDMLSLRSSVSVDVLAAEYLANTGAHGLMYTSEKVKQIAMEKYGVKEDKIYVLENLMASAVRLKERRQKLSDRDGEIHCVYEGGISPERTSHRYFEDIWMKIVGEGIHVHYYSHQNREYCLELEKRSGYFHYEGNRNLTELIEEMTQYDCGLLIFNVTKANRTFLETGSANKMYEYLNAGLPIATGCLQTYIRFVEKYGVGREIHMGEPLYKQLKKLSEIKVGNTFLEDHKLLMEQKGKELAEFYIRISKGR